MSAGTSSLPSAIPSAPADASLTMGDVIEIVRRHRTLALIASTVAFVIVLVVGSLRTPMFEAQATIALDRSRRAVDFDPRGQFDPYTGNYEHDLLNTQRTILLSRSVLEQAVKTGGLLLSEHYAGNGDVIERARERLTIMPSKESWDLSITLRDEDARRAEAGLKAIIDTYLERQVAHEKELSGNSLTFLEGQLTDAKLKMEQAREEQQTFQTKNGLFVVDVERSFEAQRLTGLNSKRVVLQQQISALEMLVAQINAIDALPEAEQRIDGMLSLELVNRHPLVVEQQKALFDLKIKEAQMIEKYLDKHPRMIEIRSQITTKRSQLNEIIGAVRGGVLADYSKLQAQLRALERLTAQTEKEINQYRENLFKLQTLTQQTKASEELYEQLLKRYGEEKVTQRLDVLQMSVVDPPHASDKPVNVRNSLLIILALLAAAAAGLGAPLAIEFFGRRTSGAADVRDLTGLPVLCELPHVANLPELGANGNPDEIAELAEAFRSLRTRVVLAPKHHEGGQVLVVTSCANGEGKSTVAARLAVSLAMSGLRVLLVDGDLRKPSLREQIGQTTERGLSELLAGTPGIAPARSTYQNLDFLDAGVAMSNPGELLNSHCLPEWLEQCREQYDYVLIDSAPLDLFSDSLLIGTHADHILLVARAGTTARASLVRARALLTPLAGKPLGAVLIGRGQLVALTTHLVSSAGRA